MQFKCDVAGGNAVLKRDIKQRLPPLNDLGFEWCELKRGAYPVERLERAIVGQRDPSARDAWRSEWMAVGRNCEAVDDPDLRRLRQQRARAHQIQRAVGAERKVDIPHRFERHADKDAQRRAVMLHERAHGNTFRDLVGRERTGGGQNAEHDEHGARNELQRTRAPALSGQSAFRVHDDA